MAEIKPRIRWLEIDITYECGMRCHNCNRLTNLIPGKPQERVTSQQITWLITESLRVNYPWEFWWLVGGEPTTHPELFDILEMISQYRDRRGPQNFQVGLATHGAGRAAVVLVEIYRRFPHVVIHNSKKHGPINPGFVAVCVSPSDRRDFSGHRFRGCMVSGHCGIAMNCRGFYPCAVSAAIDRVWKFERYISRLEDITEANMEELWQVYCRVCGYYDEIKADGTKTLLSRTWSDKLREIGVTCEEIELIGG